ncbi:MAG TPA: uracil-DNA glycosylase [Bauldia sp.]|nr:uracil-DNA glycosylase [Bauldia sp.]
MMGSGGAAEAARHHAADLLAWYAEMGVDVALEETPVDRLAERVDARRPWSPPALPRDEVPSTVRIAAATTPAMPIEETARAARAVAQAANTLDELRDALAAFEGCNLRLTATQMVFADGTPGSRVMIVGEAPGRDEDLQGLPFVGRSGQLLDRMLAAIGLSRESVYIANVVPWRPPGNRDPAPHETAACLPFIRRQIELCDPDFLLLLGKASAHTLLETTEGILRLRGRWRPYDTGRRVIQALPTLHPAYLLRQPLQKRYAWRDFLMLKAALDKAGT